MHCHGTVSELLEIGVRCQLHSRFRMGSNWWLMGVQVAIKGFYDLTRVLAFCKTDWSDPSRQQLLLSCLLMVAHCCPAGSVRTGKDLPSLGELILFALLDLVTEGVSNVAFRLLPPLVDFCTGVIPSSL